MRRIVVWLASTATVVVLLFTYPTSTNSATPTSAPSSATAPATAGSTTTASRTTDGPVAATQWGPVQVEITTSGRTITGVTVLQQPAGNHRDEEINASALPILIQETTTQQSADIDMVSGATVTSQGYLTSLQGAMDEAGI